MSKPTDKRELIVAAARRLLEDTPLAGMRMRAVAAECGLAVSSLYDHFASKNDLLEAVWQAEADELIRRFEEALAVNQSGVGGLVAFGYVVFNDFAAYRRHRSRLLEFLSDDGSAERTRELLAQRQARLRGLLAEALVRAYPRLDGKRGVRLAELVLALTEGLVVGGLYEGYRTPPEELFGELLGLFEGADDEPA
ncbi:MAG: TetR family transcriptional regulator [Candidatus Coatesbacteria bacterium]|nr:TetR family transcriptional regulator [Candidatus Coatesbacteria bacterium]